MPKLRTKIQMTVDESDLIQYLSDYFKIDWNTACDTLRSADGFYPDDGQGYITLYSDELDYYGDPGYAIQKAMDELEVTRIVILLEN